ncbi:MAG: hypothetical protein JJE04_25850 [Acidobacteriia bacterium]|nr:hypothetical protein [Terriglobia bacterium]
MMLNRRAFLLPTAAALSGFSPMPAQARTVTRRIESGVDHNHCTTRQFQHMSFCHKGVWFVFYSDGKSYWYQSSADSGENWRRADRPIDTGPNGSTSFDVALADDRVYATHVHYPQGRYDPSAAYARDPAKRGEYTSQGRVKEGLFRGGQIEWVADRDPGFTPDYCNLVRDSEGRLWIFTRQDGAAVAYGQLDSKDIGKWTQAEVCIPIQGRHAMDAAALDRGQLFAASILTTDGKLYGNLYDGKHWGKEPVLIADDVTRIAGDDRRLSLEFDPTQKLLHLLYIDAASTLRYRSLKAPYGPGKWYPRLSSPGLELGSGIFTSALSADSSRTPYGLIVTYEIEKYTGKDARVYTGELYARRFDGRRWAGRPLLVSEPDTIMNWYPNVNQDARDGLCVLYSKSEDERDPMIPLSIMVTLFHVL